MITRFVVLALVVLAFWWLSGYDAKVTGEDKRQDLIRRAARCGITLLLAGFLLALPGALPVMPMLLVIGGMLALIWAGCIAELFARWFHHLVDPADEREFDPDQGLRELDRIASLVKSGRREEAVQLSQKLRESGEVSVLVLETRLEHLGIKLESVQKPKPLTEANHRRMAGAVFGSGIHFKAVAGRRSAQCGCGHDADADLRTGFAPAAQSQENPSGARKATSCFTRPHGICPPFDQRMEPGKTQAGKGCRPAGIH